MSSAYRYGRAERDGERLPWWCVYDAATGETIMSGLGETTAIAQCGMLNAAYLAGRAEGKAEGEAEMAKLLVTIDNVLETDTCNGCKTVEGLVSPALSRSGGKT